MHLVDLLSKSEFLECSETESIADYLVKQRVITESQYDLVVNAPTRRDKNKFLIECLHENSQLDSPDKININGLLINALRYAGCHLIANTLDIDDTVLVPDKSRRKGQISIHIQVSALQITTKDLLTRSDSRNSQSTHDKSLDRSNIAPTIWLDKTAIISSNGDRATPNRRKPKKSRGISAWFCGCCRNSKKINENLEEIDGNLSDFREEEKAKAARLLVNSEIDKLRQRKIDILQEKSREFYSRVSERASVERDALIRYFEQRHQILVFETHFNDAALLVSVICMKRETVGALRALWQSGQLERDVADLLLSRALLDALGGVKNLRLTVAVSPDEIAAALREFDPSKRK